jgi:hypothetical protein
MGNPYLGPDPAVSRQVREELHRITSEGVEWERLALQANAVLAVAADHQLSIELVEQVVSGPEFNCFRYALQLRDLPEEIINVCMCANPPTGVKSDFMRKLVSERLVKRASDEVREGDLAVYWDGEAITHAGVVRRAKVESKWGRGHVWRHRVFEVRSAYGSEVRLFEPIDCTCALNEFVAHLRALYGSDLVDDYLGENLEE